MADSRSITYTLNYYIQPDVTQPATLELVKAHLDSGDWAMPPTKEIKCSPGYGASSVFTAISDRKGAKGTQGYIEYRANDVQNTQFKLTFNIPYGLSNSGDFEGGSANFEVEDGKVPKHGDQATATLSISQIKQG